MPSYVQALRNRALLKTPSQRPLSFEMELDHVAWNYPRHSSLSFFS
jgi:hypothetical protein